MAASAEDRRPLSERLAIHDQRGQRRHRDSVQPRCSPAMQSVLVAAGSVTQTISRGGTLLHRNARLKPRPTKLRRSNIAATVIAAFQNVADALTRCKPMADAARSRGELGTRCQGDARPPCTASDWELGQGQYLSLLSAQQAYHRR